MNPVRAHLAASPADYRFCSFDRRVRYWVDGLVIGSDVFVKTLVAQARGEWAVSKRRLTRAVAPDANTPRPTLYAFKQLRTIV
jgi:hypothetical protein